MTTFCIKSDDTYESVGTTPNDTKTKLLQKILSLFPRRMRERLVEIEFSTKDFAEGAASVSPLDEDGVLWQMWVNTHSEAIKDEKEIMVTIAHELTHYLTLNSTQRDSDKRVCSDMIETLNNCPTKSSVYFDFIEQFWKSIYDKSLWPEGDYNGYYDAHSDDFVTHYAVTNPSEDIAETFSFFIFEKEPTDVSKIKDKKMQYFYKFPEFVTLRSEIRSNFEREIK